MIRIYQEKKSKKKKKKKKISVAINRGKES